MLKLKFRFNCPACKVKLLSEIAGCGKTKSCPGCGDSIEVPTPAIDRLPAMIPDVPMAMPGETAEEYHVLYKRILAIAELSQRIDVKFQIVTFTQAMREQVLFSLRNLNSFVVHALEPLQASDRDVDGILRVAAGNDYAGVGGTARTVKRFERWSEGVEPEQFEMPESSLIDDVQRSIERYSSMPERDA